MTDKRFGSRHALGIVLGLGLVVLAGAGAAVAVNAAGTPESKSSVLIEKVDGAGLSYGRVLPNEGQSIRVDEIPDMIAAVGDSGIAGYVANAELDAADPEPTSPAHALELQEQRTEKRVPVYAADGKTIVDYFTIGGSPHRPERSVE